MQQLTSLSARRQFERHATKANAFVHCRGTFQSAKIVDYSAGGLHLQGTFGLIRTDPIEIELFSGLRLPASVAWSLGAHTGIAFANPMSSDHPALAELFRRAGLHSQSTGV